MNHDEVINQSPDETIVELEAQKLEAQKDGANKKNRQVPIHEWANALIEKAKDELGFANRKDAASRMIMFGYEALMGAQKRMIERQAKSKGTAKG